MYLSFEPFEDFGFANLASQNQQGGSRLNTINIINSITLRESIPNCIRILDKLGKAVENSRHYEAHQLLKTLYFRCKMQGKFEELSQILFEGTIYLLMESELNSAQDLATLYLESVSNGLRAINRNVQNDHTLSFTTVEEHQQAQTIDYKISKNLSLLLYLFKIKSNDPERQKKLTTDTFKATTCAKNDTNIINLGLIHFSFAMVHWGSNNYADSRYHFLHAFPIDCAYDCASMLVEYHLNLGNPSEFDLFLANFILQLLCVPEKKQISILIENSNEDDSQKQERKTRTCQMFASEVFNCYTQIHPKIKRESLPPLINFLKFLMEMIEKGREETWTFKKLCEVYRPALARDPVFKDYLVKIGSVYFGIESRQSSRPSGGLLSNLLQSILQDDTTNETNNSVSSDTSDDQHESIKNTPKRQQNDEEMKKIQEDELD